MRDRHRVLLKSLVTSVSVCYKQEGLIECNKLVILTRDGANESNSKVLSTTYQ